MLRFSHIHDRSRTLATMPIVLDEKDWARIKKWTNSDKEDPDVVRRREYVNFLTATSREMTKHWPNSVEVCLHYTWYIHIHSCCHFRVNSWLLQHFFHIYEMRVINFCNSFLI